MFALGDHRGVDALVVFAPLALVIQEGVDLARWQSLSGRDPDPDREQFLIEHGFIERLGNSRLRCTPPGMLILDAVVADLAC